MELSDQVKIERRVINGHSLAVYETNVSRGQKSIVIFCHGFRSSAIGPNRFFVRAANALAAKGISSLRFDQYGSGNSDGDFIDSEFDDWVDTIIEIAKTYLARSYQVALFGQSMGAAATIVAASRLADLAVAVCWVPDPSIDEFVSNGLPYHEECGERVGIRFWEQAHNAKIPEALSSVPVPMFIVQCGNDEYVSKENHQAIVKYAQPQHTIKMYPGYKHSQWTYEQATDIIDKSVAYLVDHL